MQRCLFVALCACSHATATPATRSSPACASPEARQLDFWIGDWDVTVHARTAPGSEQWGTASGHQHVEAVLRGCAIAENFTADGPKQPWAGKSLSSWQPALGKWRQTWVDDQGGYLLFTGGVEDGAMTLYGEPRAGFQMRMVFRDVTARSLHWEWQRSVDGWKTFEPMMKIDYQR